VDLGEATGASQATKAESVEFGFGELSGEVSGELIGELVPRFTNPPRADRCLLGPECFQIWSKSVFMHWRSILPSIDLS